MKKLLVLLFASVVFQSNAQEFAKDNNVISAGLGLGGAFGSYNYSAQTPGLSLQYERGIWPIDGPGVISLGGYLGVKSYKYETASGGYYTKQKWNWTVIGVRSAYHYTGETIDNLDVYAGLMLSYNYLSYKYSSNVFGGYSGPSYGSRAGISIYAGGRYYLAENLAGFLELGYGVSYATIGLALRIP